MCTEHPTDLSPLSYGAGLTLGLFLIIGLPAQPGSLRRSRGQPAAHDARLAHAPEAAASTRRACHAAS